MLSLEIKIEIYCISIIILTRINLINYMPRLDKTREKK